MPLGSLSWFIRWPANSRGRSVCRFSSMLMRSRTRVAVDEVDARGSDDDDEVTEELLDGVDVKDSLKLKLRVLGAVVHRRGLDWGYLG